MLSRSFYLRHPREFFSYHFGNLIARKAQPNRAHLALAKLEAAGKLQALITQNIDGLHQAAGSKNVIELHGNTYRFYCEKCQKPTPWMKPRPAPKPTASPVFSLPGTGAARCGAL